MSVSSVTSSTFDANLTDDDFDPVFTLVALMADLSEEFADYYEQAADELDTASDWLTWFGENVEDNGNFDPDNEAELVAFASWMDDIGFDYTKYFNTTETDDGETRVTEIKDDSDNDPKYENEEVSELLSIEVDSISADAEQANVITSGLIDDYSDGTEELISMIDTLRSAGRGHIRS